MGTAGQLGTVHISNKQRIQLAGTHDQGPRKAGLSIFSVSPFAGSVCCPAPEIRGYLRYLAVVETDTEVHIQRVSDRYRYKHGQALKYRNPGCIGPAEIPSQEEGCRQHPPAAAKATWKPKGTCLSLRRHSSCRSGHLASNLRVSSASVAGPHPSLAVRGHEGPA